MIAAALLLAAMLLTDAPMTDDEVVRRVVAGEPVEAILADVKRRPPAFDVSEEMLGELRRTGVPEVLITEMVARTAAATPKEEPPPAPAAGAAPSAPAASAAPARPMGAVRLLSKEDTLTVPRRMDPQLIAELELPAGALEADALALAVLCTTRGHDDPGALRWPEGALPKELKQGRLVGFFTSTEGSDSGSKLKVPLGKALTVPLLADVSHDLQVVAVVRASGHWAILGGDELTGVRTAAGAFASAELEAKRDRGFVRVKVSRPDDAALPELPRAEGWARDGFFSVHDARRDGQAVSPDGRKRVLVKRDGASLEIEGMQAGALTLPPTGDIEVVWSPDSRAFAITRGSATQMAAVAWRIEADDAVHPLALPEDAKESAAVGFAGDGSRLLLVTREGHRLTGYLVKTSDGSVAGRFTELEIRARWGDRLGPRLR